LTNKTRRKARIDRNKIIASNPAAKIQVTKRVINKKRIIHTKRNKSREKLHYNSDI